MKYRVFLASLLTAVLCAGPFAAADARTPNDPLYDKQWYLPLIGAETAWEKTTGSPAVVVAVIDTAIDIDHEDLKENIWVNADEVFGNGLDDDANGFIDDVNGWNFETASWDVRPTPTAGDEIGYIHGTAVASLIGARGDNGVGIAGVAWYVRLMPVVALDAVGSGTPENVAAAIRYAVQNGASIINLSLEGYNQIPVVEAALEEAQAAGILTVAAAGNAEEREGINLDDVPVFPVCLSNDVRYGVFGVGSVNQEKQRAGFTNYGSCILASAPGQDIFGAHPVTPHDGEPQTEFPGYIGGLSGTSLATPLVSGSAALLKSLRPDWGWAALREWLMASAAPIDHLQEATYRFRVGRGLIDVGAAVAGVPEAVAQTSPTDPRAVLAADEVQKTLRSPFRVVVGDGLVLAEAAGGRAVGIAADGTATPFYPYGDRYRAGLQAVAVPGGVAFAPRSGGGHLMVTDLVGRRMVSVFPFGKTVRGQWSVGLLSASEDAPSELFFAGPTGLRAVPLDRIGADGWREISSAEKERRLIR